MMHVNMLETYRNSGNFDYGQMYEIEGGLERDYKYYYFIMRGMMHMNMLDTYKSSGSFNEQQMQEIQEELESGLDVSIYANPKFNDMQMYEIREGLKSGLDVTIYADPGFEWLQMDMIREGMESGLDVTIYAKSEFTWRQMDEIERGLKSGLDVTVYADPKFSVEQMSEIREGMESSLKENYDKQKLTTDMAELGFVPVQDDVFPKEIEYYQERESRLFVDMDGTLAKYQPVDTMETLFEKGYFLNLESQQNVVDAVKKIIKEHPETPVYIMSSVLSDSKYALQEKNEWLDKYLPEIDSEHRIFPPCGKNKLEYVPEGIRTLDYLLDDYTNNLALWEPPAKGIKLLNGINHTNGTWKGSMLRYDKEPEWLAEDIVRVMHGMEIQDKRPLHQMVSMENQLYDKEFKSGYISEGEKSQLEFLTRAEALAALREGIHICYVNDFPVYHGIHADEFSIIELKGEKGVQNLYNTYGQGVIHKACISPYYAQPGKMKDFLKAMLLQESNVSEAQKGTEIKKTARKELTI